MCHICTKLSFAWIQLRQAGLLSLEQCCLHCYIVLKVVWVFPFIMPPFFLGVCNLVVIICFWMKHYYKFTEGEQFLITKLDSNWYSRILSGEKHLRTLTKKMMFPSKIQFFRIDCVRMCFFKLNIENCLYFHIFCLLILHSLPPGDQY